MKKIIASLAGSLVVLFALTACWSGGTEAAAYEERKNLAAEYDTAQSLELNNLKEKRAREDDPNKIRYVYVMSYAEIIGYYVAQGKISSSASQIAPETEIIRVPGISGGYNQWSVESAKDDGSYGPGDPGIFFFTTDGTMIETDLNYIVSDNPIAVDVPRLYGN